MAILRFDLLVAVIKLLSSGHTPLIPADVISDTTKCLHVDDISNIKNLFYFGRDLDELLYLVVALLTKVLLVFLLKTRHVPIEPQFPCFSTLHANDCNAHSLGKV